MNNIIFNIPKEFILRYYFNEEDSELPDFRSSFMRDRDRVMYSTAFRRLGGKTQIYTIGIDDHRKNRLTHSLEVSQIARTISKALNLDTDLTEAIALGHDLGHTPFGHEGERMLHEIMIPNSQYIKESPYYQCNQNKIQENLEKLPNSYADICNFDRMFGFKHNIQSLRVACKIEDSYRDKDGRNIGLNLTNYTLWGILNHTKIKYNETESFPNYQMQFKRFLTINGLETEAWSLEAHVVRISDDIAQWHHDLEDAIRGHAIPLERICYTIEGALQKRLNDNEKRQIENIRDNHIEDRFSIAALSHIVVNTLVNDICENSYNNLNTIHDEVIRNFPGNKNEDIAKKFYSDYDHLGLSIPNDKIIAFSDKIDRKKFIDEIKYQVHHSFDVERMNSKGKYIIRKLFEAYFSNPQQLPDGYIFHYMVDVHEYDSIEKAKSDGAGIVRTKFNERMKRANLIDYSILMRRICDHIACMTDNYAIEEYHRLYG